MGAMSKSSNQVSIKIDSRLFYTLIAVLAVIGIFAIGMWIGQQVSGPKAPAGTSAAGAKTDSSVPVAPAGTVQPGLSTNNVQIATAPAAAADAKGKPPVSPKEQPVGPNESRLGVKEINADNNYTFAMGNIPADQKTERQFTLENLGTATLVIENTSASCGCTAAVADKKELAPGESTTLHVGYDPRVNQEYGKFIQKQVRIKSNDPVVPLVEFTITAEVAAQ
jgi:hypothetical protein